MDGDGLTASPAAVSCVCKRLARQHLWGEWVPHVLEDFAVCRLMAGPHTVCWCESLPLTQRHCRKGNVQLWDSSSLLVFGWFRSVLLPPEDMEVKPLLCRKGFQLALTLAEFPSCFIRKTVEGLLFIIRSEVMGHQNRASRKQLGLPDAVPEVILQVCHAQY